MPTVPLEWLPAASRAELSGGGAWAYSAGPIRPKGLLHTTETLSWPGYGGGGDAPHATVRPLPGKGVEVRQHSPFSEYGRALVHRPGSPETNRYPYVLQFELIGTCSKRGPGYYWPNADDAVLKDLYSKVMKPLNDAFGIPMRSPRWLDYDGTPSSAGASPVRMSNSTFQGYTGWLGHEHAPQNDHGDPGLFPWARLVALVGRPVPSQPGKSAIVYPVIKRGYGMPPATPNAWVKRLQRDLVNHGYHLAIDGCYGLLTEAAVRNYQSHHGLVIDGIAGPRTFGSLEG